MISPFFYRIRDFLGSQGTEDYYII
jgi:hypothetical protein